MAWPSFYVPNPAASPEDRLRELERTTLEMVKILRGGVVLGGLGADALPNSDTAIVEISYAYAVGTPTSIQVDNPLGREPVGVICIWGPSYVIPSGVVTTSPTITSGSKTVTGTSFTTSMEKGYLIYNDGSNNIYKIKIDTRDSSTQLTLQDPAPASGSGNALIMLRWHDDSVYITVNTVSPSVSADVWRLLFF